MVSVDYNGWGPKSGADLLRRRINADGRVIPANGAERCGRRLEPAEERDYRL